MKNFIVQAYVRGSSCPSAEKAELEGSTSIFTKRRYRDRWNRGILVRLSKSARHNLKVKARIRSKGSRGGQAWFSERQAKLVRKRARPQAAWQLRLAGDFHESFQEGNTSSRPRHLMRVMMVANLSLANRFANGTQGRVLYWNPEDAPRQKAGVLASHPELMARFAKESSMRKTELLPDVDFLDVTPRPEQLTSVAFNPLMVQLPLQPCYGLTVHKSQAMSIKHFVRGCLEGGVARRVRLVIGETC